MTRHRNRVRLSVQRGESYVLYIVYITYTKYNQVKDTMNKNIAKWSNYKLCVRDLSETIGIALELIEDLETERVLQEAMQRRVGAVKRLLSGTRRDAAQTMAALG